VDGRHDADNLTGSARYPDVRGRRGSATARAGHTPRTVIRCWQVRLGLTPGAYAILDSRRLLNHLPRGQERAATGGRLRRMIYTILHASLRSVLHGIAAIATLG
jgi:hypothetical protein